MTDTSPWPTALTLSKDRKTLSITFDNGESYDLAAEYLRVESPSAEVQGHSASERKFIKGKERVTIMTIDAVGHYAIRLNFDDMHSTGIYPWDYLIKLGRERETIWAKYQEGLALKGRIH